MSAKSQALAAVLNTYLSSRPAKHALFNAARIATSIQRAAKMRPLPCCQVKDWQKGKGRQKGKGLSTKPNPLSQG